MKRKTILWILLVLVLAGVGYGLKEFYRTRPDSKSLEPKFTVEANSILKEFAGNEAQATQKYNGKDVILAVSGNLKEIKQDEKGYFTLLLGDTADLSSIQCSMDTVYVKDISTVKAGQNITIQGYFTGYNADVTGMLGADVQLNNCVLVSKK